MPSILSSTLLITIVLSISGNAAIAQSSLDALGGASDAAQRLFDGRGTAGTDTVYDATDVEQQAQFPGGDQALREFIRADLHYPNAETDADIQGEVLIGFVVEQDGRLSNVRTVGSVSPGLDQEALEAVRKMPNWIPAQRNAKPVAMRVILPIQFQLK